MLSLILIHNNVTKLRDYCMMHNQGIEMVPILFYIYWLYQVILNLVYRWFINTLTNSVRNIVRKLTVTKYLYRLVILDCVRSKNLTVSSYCYK